MLIDNHNRKVNYLRLAVTDRCNLRCNYCMPEGGINFAKKDKLLTIEELIRLSKILVEQGIEKIRLTGGEPFVRKDIMLLIEQLTRLEGLKDISVTTNATLIGPYIKQLKELGVRNINLSLDAIQPETFNKITRRDQYQTVFNNLIQLISEGFNVRINFVVLRDQNLQDIIPMVDLTKDHDVSVRFLEEMPFNGGSKEFDKLNWDYKKIFNYISEHYSGISEIPSEKTSTSINYKIYGYKGTFGLIPSFTRTFCGSCNRLRISATGDVITCLYGKPKMNLREIMRAENSEERIKEHLLLAVGTRAKNGFEAQNENDSVLASSMTSIGG